ncbi:MAG: hypothetical protein V4607_11285 [Pseudomonadota bacterium]
MKKMNAAVMILAIGSGLAASMTFASDSAVGKLLSADGGVLIQRPAKTDIASTGTIVGVGDTILTTDTGSTQWLMSDTSVFSMAADSGLKINKYALPSSTNANGVASYTLLQGAVRTITGKIGKNVAANAPHNVYSAATGRFHAENLIKVAAAPAGPYTLKTALAVITTQGADFTAAQSGNAIKVLVTAGSAAACNVAGCATANAGEGIVISCAGCKPATAASATLGLDGLILSLAFTDGQSPEVSNQPQATHVCRTVLGRIMGGANCQNADGGNPDTEPPVSPN